MAVSDYVASASLFSDGSGSFTTGVGGYYNGAFSTSSVQFTHTGGLINRSGSGWGSCAWNTQYGPDSIVIVTIGATGEFELELRGKDMASSNWDAYGLYVDNAGGFEVYRTINASATTLTTGSVTLGVGDKIAFMALGSGATVTLSAAKYTAGAWGADLFSYGDTNAARLVNSGYIGIWANGTSFGADDFSGGTAALSGGGGGSPAAAFVPTKMLMGVGR